MNAVICRIVENVTFCCEAVLFTIASYLCISVPLTKSQSCIKGTAKILSNNVDFCVNASHHRSQKEVNN